MNIDQGQQLVVSKRGFNVGNHHHKRFNELVKLHPFVALPRLAVAFLLPAQSRILHPQTCPKRRFSLSV